MDREQECELRRIDYLNGYEDGRKEAKARIEELELDVEELEETMNSWEGVYDKLATENEKLKGLIQELARIAAD